MDHTEAKSASTYNYEYKKKTLVDCLKVRMDEGDWKGVSEFANELRVMEAVKGDRKFLVQSGIKISETEINGEKFTEVRRG